MEKPTEQEESCLQCLLGVDKRNPCLTVYRDLSKGQLQVYYGHELLEVVGDDREQVGFKILVGRLYNAGLKIGCLQRQFEVDPKTMKRWGEALQSGDAETLGRVLAGRRWHRKLTREIRSFVRVRFFEIYEQSRYAYSKKIRGEIEEVFAVSLSGETLRPLFKELKEALAKEAEQRRGQIGRLPGILPRVHPCRQSRSKQKTRPKAKRRIARSLPILPRAVPNRCSGVDI